MKMKEEERSDANVESTSSSDKPQECETSSSREDSKPEEKKLSDSFTGICQRVDKDMDQEFIDKAWNQVERVRQECVLEGEDAVWYACAIYMTTLMGSPVERQTRKKYSVTKLLQECNISVLEFFEKITKWVAMLRGPKRLREHINRIESSLAVTAVVYKKYLPIFRKIFARPPIEHSKGAPHHKIIFELIWMLFIVAKKDLNCNELINAYHLLLCSIDFIYQDLCRSRLAHLIDTDFVKTVHSDENSSVMVTLCEQFEGVVLDAKHFRTHVWLPRLRELITKGVIEVAAGELGFIKNRETNLDKLTEYYEEVTKNRGEVDERMFWPVDFMAVFNPSFDGNAIERLRRPAGEQGDEVDAGLLLRMSTQSCLERIDEQRQQRAPIIGRSYVISSEQFCPAAPVDHRTYSIKKLDQLAYENWKRTSSHLEMIMTHERKNAMRELASAVQRLSTRLEESVLLEQGRKSAGYDESFADKLKTRIAYVENLFYRFLEKIAQGERDREPTKIAELCTAMNNEEFITSLYVLSLQLVLFTYESVREFPWCLEVFKLPAIQFYKIIEVVVRDDADLTRDMVKHLNRVEERVLEELAWEMTSPLWDILRRHADIIPSSESVNLDTVEGYDARHGNPSMSLRYLNSPVKQGAKRRLEFSDEPPPPKRRNVDTEGVPRTSAIIFFFRKVYYLAAIRLLDLCERVKLDERGRQRAWTLFEHILRTETSLMMGRHLDQNLMCCLYVVAKVGQQTISFHDIMYHYRHQPQSSSRVYRRVLFESPLITTTVTDERSVASQVLARIGSAVRCEASTNYVDLIKYYNVVFVGRVESFVKKLQPGIVDLKESGIELLPLPPIRRYKLSPMRVVADNVYVVPMPTTTQMSTVRPMRYSINRSPSKDLRSINLMVHNAGRSLAASGNLPQPHRGFGPRPMI